MVAPLVLKIGGPELMVRFVTGQQMARTDDNGMGHRDNGPLLPPTGGQAMIQGRHVGPYEWEVKRVERCFAADRSKVSCPTSRASSALRMGSSERWGGSAKTWCAEVRNCCRQRVGRSALRRCWRQRTAALASPRSRCQTTGTLHAGEHRRRFVIVNLRHGTIPHDSIGEGSVQFRGSPAAPVLGSGGLP